MTEDPVVSWTDYTDWTVGGEAVIGLEELWLVVNQVLNDYMICNNIKDSDTSAIQRLSDEIELVRVIGGRKTNKSDEIINPDEIKKLKYLKVYIDD